MKRFILLTGCILLLALGTAPAQEQQNGAEVEIDREMEADIQVRERNGDIDVRIRAEDEDPEREIRRDEEYVDNGSVRIRERNGEIDIQIRPEDREEYRIEDRERNGQMDSERERRIIIEERERELDGRMEPDRERRIEERERDGRMEPDRERRGIDPQRIERHTRVRGQMQEGVYTITLFPRVDQLSVAGVNLPAGMMRTSQITFSQVDGQAMVLGELIVLQNQVNPIIDIALQNNLNVDSLTNPFLWDQPRVMLLQISGTGDVDELASAVGQIIARTGRVAEPPRDPRFAPTPREEPRARPQLRDGAINDVCPPPPPCPPKERRNGLACPPPREEARAEPRDGKFLGIFPPCPDLCPPPREEVRARDGGVYCPPPREEVRREPRDDGRFLGIFPPCPDLCPPVERNGAQEIIEVCPPPGGLTVCPGADAITVCPAPEYGNGATQVDRSREWRREKRVQQDGRTYHAEPDRRIRDDSYEYERDGRFERDERFEADVRIRRDEEFRRDDRRLPPPRDRRLEMERERDGRQGAILEDGGLDLTVTGVDPDRTELTVQRLQNTLGVRPTEERGVYKFNFDQQIQVRGQQIDRAAGIGSEVSFAGTDENAIVYGDIGVREGQLQDALRALRQQNITVLSISHRFTQEEPRMIFINFMGVGPAEQLAQAVRSALEAGWVRDGQQPQWEQQQQQRQPERF